MRQKGETFFLEPFREVVWVTYGLNLNVFNPLSRLIFLATRLHATHVSPTFPVILARYLLNLKEPWILQAGQDVKYDAISLLILWWKIPTLKLRS